MEKEIHRCKTGENQYQIRIRTAERRDREALEEICLATAMEQARKHALLREAFLMVFCDYYVQQEREHCFVAVDEKDAAVGYILGAPSFEKWEREIHSSYLDRSENVIAKSIVKGEAETMRPFAERYPAHLHIDILPQYQRMGLGSRLMDVLRDHLRKQGIKGVMLGVSSDNEKGKSFYRRYGFEELARDDSQIVMGISC